MFKFVVRRLLLLVPILIGLSILVFVWIRALPGGPAEALLGERATPEAIEQIREQYGLDKPVYVQYWEYVRTTAQGDLGTSVTTRRPVIDELEQRFPATIELAIAALIFAIAARDSARVLRREALRDRDRPREPLRLAARDLDPGLLPRDPAQVRLRGEARAGYQPSAGSTRDDRPRAPDELLLARRPARGRPGRVLGRRAST